MSAPDHLFLFSLPALSVSVQATFISHFSRPSKSASPSSPLLPRALHSTNSTFMGSWEKSKSLPFFPSWAGLPVAEPSRLVGAAERVTRRVLLQGEKGKGQELSTRGISPAPRLWDVWDPALPAGCQGHKAQHCPVRLSQGLWPLLEGTSAEAQGSRRALKERCSNKSGFAIKDTKSQMVTTSLSQFIHSKHWNNHA